MKFKFILFISLVSCSVFAQESSDSSMHKVLMDSDYCLKYKTNSFDKFTKYIKNQQPDSISHMIEYIQTQCDDTSIFKDLNVLLSIYHDDWKEKFGEDYFIQEIIQYIEMPVIKYWGYGYYRRSSSHLETLALGFHERELAKLIVKTHNVDKSTVAYLYLLVKGEENDSLLFTQIQSEPFRSSIIYETYLKRLVGTKKQLNKSRTEYAVFLGYWHPKDNLNVVGDKAEVGLLWGIFNKPFHYNLIGLMRQGQVQKDYYVKKDGIVYPADYFFGGYIGVEFGYEYLKIKSLKQMIALGVGYSGFTAVRKNDDHDKIAVESFNVNASLYNRFYLNKHKTKYFGFVFRYNVVNYRSGGTALNGNTLSLSFTYGWSSTSNWNSENYDNLHFKD